MEDIESFSLDKLLAVSDQLKTCAILFTKRKINDELIRVCRASCKSVPQSFFSMLQNNKENWKEEILTFSIILKKLIKVVEGKKDVEKLGEEFKEVLNQEYVYPYIPAAKGSQPTESLDNVSVSISTTASTPT